MCAANDYELHCVSETPFDQREFTPPLEQDIVGTSTSRNVRRRLVPGHSGILGNAAVSSGRAELHLRTANTIRGCNTADINCVPIRRVFDRFRNMCAPYIEADSMTHPDIEASGAGRNVRSRLSAGYSSMLRNANVFSGATTDTIRGRVTADINCVPVRRVFDQFRNMRAPYIEADCMTQPAIRKRSLSIMAELCPTVCADNRQSSKAKMLKSASDCLIQRPILTDTRRNIVCQSPALTVNQAYLCLDIKDCNITPTIIDFPTNALEDIHDKHLLTKYLRGCAQDVHNE
ncbi:hypothetical protein Tco_0900473, partial [Tanacetum coccineum]